MILFNILKLQKNIIFKGIVTIFEWFEYEKTFLMVMEKPNGYISLDNYIKEKGTFPEKDAKKVYTNVSLLFMICKHI